MAKFENRSVELFHNSVLGLPNNPEQDDVKYAVSCAFVVLDEFLTALKILSYEAKRK